MQSEPEVTNRSVTAKATMKPLVAEKRGSSKLFIGDLGHPPSTCEQPAPVGCPGLGEAVTSSDRKEVLASSVIWQGSSLKEEFSTALTREKHIPCCVGL